MPCMTYDDEPPRIDPHNNPQAEMLCAVLKELERDTSGYVCNVLSTMPSDIKAWWKEHKKRDLDKKEKETHDLLLSLRTLKIRTKSFEEVLKWARPDIQDSVRDSIEECHVKANELSFRLEREYGINVDEALIELDHDLNKRITPVVR